MIRLCDLDTMARAYVQCALWLSMDESDDRGGEPMDTNYSAADLAPETLERMAEDCAAFREALAPGLRDLIDADPVRAGRDFWLTRNGAGAGFWDGDWPADAEDALTLAAQRFGELNLYVGADGLIRAE